MEQKKKIKIVIVILAVLLALSLAALAGMIINNKLSKNKPATVIVPDNLITSDADKNNTDSNTKKQDNTESKTPSELSDTVNPTQTISPTATETKKAATISLYDKQSEENTPFHVGNMFPGDSITKYFRVQVSYHDKVTMHYHADIRPGYQKLSEVLKVKIKLLSTGETMYDGLMRDMPESVTYKLSSPKSTTDELYYEITAYLDTSVGNDYQNKDLITDFKWWVEETGNLEPSPKTGDTSNIVLAAFLTVATGCALILLFYISKRKEEDENV